MLDLALDFEELSVCRGKFSVKILAAERAVGIIAVTSLVIIGTFLLGLRFIWPRPLGTELRAFESL